MNSSHSDSHICYLCGQPLDGAESNRDHVFQQQFVARDQPKAKGFDYAGTLRVHVACNARFGNTGEGPESVCGKALQLLDVLYSDDSQRKVRKDDPNIRIWAINSNSLPNFSSADIEYFGFIDVSTLPYEAWTRPEFFEDKPMMNPLVKPLNIALSTLVKSTAAFLVKRYDASPSGNWRILVIPHHGPDARFDLDEQFGATLPLESGIKLWIKSEHNGWFAAYKFNQTLLFICIERVASEFFSQVARTFQEAECLYFSSDRLIDLVGYRWTDNKYPL